MNGELHVRFLLKDAFRVADYQAKATYGLVYKSTLTKNKDEAVLQKTEAIVDTRNKIDRIHWYVPL